MKSPKVPPPPPPLKVFHTAQVSHGQCCLYKQHLHLILLFSHKETINLDKSLALFPKVFFAD